MFVCLQVLGAAAPGLPDPDHIWQYSGGEQCTQREEFTDCYQLFYRFLGFSRHYGGLTCHASGRLC